MGVLLIEGSVNDVRPPYTTLLLTNRHVTQRSIERGAGKGWVGGRDCQAARSFGLARSKARGWRASARGARSKGPVLLSRFRNVGGGRVVQQEHLGSENEHSPPPESGRADAAVSDIIVNGGERATRGSRQESDGVPMIVTIVAIEWREGETRAM